MFSLLSALGAWISLPIGQVPLTLQTVFILMAGLLLSMPYAVLSVVVYLIAGAVGLPIFAGGKSGLETFTGPTGGFLFGFILGVLMVSYLSRNTKYKILDQNWKTVYLNAVIPCIIGSIIIHICGMTWGKIYTGNQWEQIYEAWLEPFYFNMILKILIAAIVSAEIWKYHHFRSTTKGS